MTSAFDQRVAELTGRTVYDRDGKKIGKIGGVFLDENTGRPEWVTVHTGLFGLKESFLPIESLRAREDGDLETPFTKDQVKDAPKVDPDGDHLDPEEERRLFSHYGLTGDAPGPVPTPGHDDRRNDRDEISAGEGVGTAGDDTKGIEPSPDDREPAGVGTAGADTEGIHPDPDDRPEPAGVGTAGAETKGIHPDPDDRPEPAGVGTAGAETKGIDVEAERAIDRRHADRGAGGPAPTDVVRYRIRRYVVIVE